ncbi:MAG: peptide ABC transporter ATP-binding protein [Planctomycetes bacterium DG_23]|nr:MAG: peptide ABC transporter ATP-binding protein [Planctomycetes bacterium DG_23]
MHSAEGHNKNTVDVKRDERLLSIRDLKTYFFTDEGTARAVDGVDFDILEGKTVGLVGESGCGKTVTALSILRLVPRPAGRIVEGEVTFKNQNLLLFTEPQMRRVRGNDIAMIFQEPQTSLNPVFTVGNQIMEAIVLHQKASRREARTRTVELLHTVGIPSPEMRVDEYPHQLSGGMKQRVMIAMALACGPDLLIADEPTTALDVTIQAQILDLLQGLQEEFGMSILLITHDLGIIAQLADEINIMYAGKIVEHADAEELFSDPKHPYTMGLFESLPKLGAEKKRLVAIPGVVPNPLNWPAGCRFHPRCRYVMDICPKKEPPLKEIAPGRTAACWLYFGPED